MQAENKESARILAAVAERIELLGRARPGPIHHERFTHRQFQAIRRSLQGHRRAQGIADRASRRRVASASAEADADADADADVVPPAEIQKSREYETVRASHDDDDDDDDPIHARADEHAS